MIEPCSSFVNIDDMRLHYLEWDSQRSREELAVGIAADRDSDEVPLVMLHGLGASADTWRLMARHFCDRHLAIAFDQRGHGQSEQPDGAYTLTTIAEDAIRAMAALGLGQVALAGHGWGARVALSLAARHPALISHLVLIDCPHIEPRHWPGMTRERFIRENAPKDMYASRTSFLGAMRAEMADFWSPEVEEIIMTYVRELPNGRIEERLLPENQRRIRESLWEDRALSYYSKLSCPVLLIPAAKQPRRGEEPPERLESADDFAAAKGYMATQVERTIHRCSVLWMPGSAHDIQLQHPQLLADAIADFMRT